MTQDQFDELNEGDIVESVLSKAKYKVVSTSRPSAPSVQITKEIIKPRLDKYELYSKCIKEIGNETESK